MAHLATNSLIQNRRIGLDPAPPNAKEDDHFFEMPPAECRPFSGDDKPYQIGSCICNRTDLLAHRRAVTFSTAVGPRSQQSDFRPNASRLQHPQRYFQ
jgi:hypothetical protein